MTTDALDAAFRATTYRVEFAGVQFELRIGQSNPGLDNLLTSQGASGWAIVTACNPGGVRTDSENAQRQAGLQERLRVLGVGCWPACNVADDGAWPPEPGFFIVDVPEEEIRVLALEFAQAALVCGKVGTEPRLIWTRTEK